jgi:hypothetical protein
MNQSIMAVFYVYRRIPALSLSADTLIRFTNNLQAETGILAQPIRAVAADAGGISQCPPS